MGGCFSFIHLVLPSDIHQAPTVSRASDTALGGEGTGAENVKESGALGKHGKGREGETQVEGKGKPAAGETYRYRNREGRRI